VTHDLEHLVRRGKEVHICMTDAGLTLFLAVIGDSAQAGVTL